MRVPLIKAVTLGLAAVLVMGMLDAASARQKKTPPHLPARVTQTDRIPGTLVPMDREGTPIIMQGYRSPRMMRTPSARARQRAVVPSEFRAAAAPTSRRPIRRPIPSTARRRRR